MFQQFMVKRLRPFAVVAFVLYTFCNLAALCDENSQSIRSTNLAQSESRKSLPVKDSQPQVAAAEGGSLMPRVTSSMVRYSRTRYAIYFVQSALDILFVYLLLQTGVSDSLRKFAQRRNQALFWQLAIYVTLIYSFIFLASLPLNFYSGFWLEHSMHLSDQPFLPWLAERLQFLTVRLALAIPLWFLLLTVIRKFPQKWPVVLFLSSVPLILTLVFAAPLFIDPIFNKFKALENNSLHTRINELTQKAGLTNAPIFLSDHSKQSNKVNAYVTGIGSSARVVIWDTTLKKLPNDQVLSVVAHELGHYVLGHIYWGCAISILVSLLLVPFNYFCVPQILPRLPTIWAVQAPEDMTVIPVVILFSLIISFFSDPVINGYSRRVEHEADAFGLSLTGDGPAMARCFVSLSEQNLSEPDPPKFIEFWLFSHPTLKDRIQFALGKPNP